MASLKERVQQLEADLADLRRKGAGKTLQLTLAFTGGQQITAPPHAWIIAMIAELTPQQQQSVINKVAKMGLPAPGKHILMPNGGYPSDVLGG